jgi:hypothetical protein
VYAVNRQQDGISGQHPARMLDDKYLCRMKLNGLKVRADIIRGVMLCSALVQMSLGHQKLWCFFWCGYMSRPVRWLWFVYAVNRQQGGISGQHPARMLDDKNLCRMKLKGLKVKRYRCEPCCACCLLTVVDVPSCCATCKPDARSNRSSSQLHHHLTKYVRSTVLSAV